MFGFPGSAPFGQPAQQAAPAFGSQPASPFGASFGQPAQPAASPFGATTGGAPLFGTQSPTPAFGQGAPAAAPAFGATTSTTGFGAGAFGGAAKPAGFGGFGTTTTAAPNPFGAPAQTPGAFGAPAQSAPAFGAGLGTAPSFGATLTPAPAFGASSTSAFGAPQSVPAFGGFGAASAPAFGATAAAPTNPFGATTTGFGATTAPAFGTASAATGFGAPTAGAAAPFGSTTTNLFGNPSAAPSAFGNTITQPAGGFGGFGGNPAPGSSSNGTRNLAYSKTKDSDVVAGQQPTYLVSISALPSFQPPNPSKSHEELRWEDYQEGVKNQSAGPAPTATGAFGAPTAAPSAFGGFGSTTQPATTGFGTTTATNPFGAPASTPAFGSNTAPAFGATAASQPSLFGTTTAPAAASNPFGGAATTAPAFGGFGAAQAAGSQPSLFGNTTTTTTGFGTASPFGSTTPFGGASSAAAFSFNSSPSTFGGASAPSTGIFGTAPASSPFGGTGTLGAVSSPQPFGGASSASAFGSSTFGTFGATAAKPASPFGTTTTTPFGTTAPAAAGPSLFTAAPFSFNSQPASSPSVFGNTATGTTMSFTSGLFGNQLAAPAGGTTIFGATGAVPVAQAQPPTVAQPAYGSFGALPAMPEVKVGITTRMPRNNSISSGKASPLLSLRTTPTRYGASVRVRTEPSTGITGSLASAGPPLSASTDLLAPVPSSFGSAAATVAAGGGGTGLLPLRQNPHRLFIAAPPPSTEAAVGPASLTPTRPPSAHRGTTPDHAVGAQGDGPNHNDGGAAKTPDGRQAGAGANGYSNGYNGIGTSGAAAGAGPNAAVGRASAPVFQDSLATEPYLPRLGRLASEGYSFTPNVDELRLLYRQNPENLAAVSNFTVINEGVGKIRWVAPVDVRGLELDKIITIAYGKVICYPDNSAKPPLGQGLNKPAEVTLYGIYKKDKVTGAPIREGPRGQAFEKLLRETCARNNSRFISYKLDGGAWKFEVEHFSWYGLRDDMDDDSDDEVAEGMPAAEGAEEGVGEVGVAGANAGQPTLAGRGLVGLGLRGFAFGGGGGGGGADGALGRNQILAAGEDSGMEPSVGLRQRAHGALMLEAGGSDTTGAAGAGADQDISETGGHPRGGEEIMADGEVSDELPTVPEVFGQGARYGPGPGNAGAGRFPFGGRGAFRSGPGDGALTPFGAAGPPVMPAAPLQHALPASLAQDALQFRALHDAFFSKAAAAGGPRGYLSQSHQQQQQQQQLALPSSAGSAQVKGGGAAARGPISRATAATAVTSWRRPAAALAPGPAIAVLARGGELALGVPDAAAGGSGCSGGGFRTALLSPPMTPALAQPIMTLGVSLEKGSRTVALPEVGSAENYCDAGLILGRSFRVGWGPNDKLAIPGIASSAVDGRYSMEICIVRARVEGTGASYGSSLSSEDVEGLEAVRERLRSALEVHMSASRSFKGPMENRVLPYWSLCIDSRELPELVKRHISIGERQLHQLLGGDDDSDGRGGSGGIDLSADHPDVPRLRHELETWKLMDNLFSRIPGEVADEEVDMTDDGLSPSEVGTLQLQFEVARGSPTGNSEGRVAEMLDATPNQAQAPASMRAGRTSGTPADQDMHDGDSSEGEGADDDGKGARVDQVLGVLLAVLQRRARISTWLQRQAKRMVQVDLQTASSSAQVVLQLLAAHQLAAATGAAVASGDPRLAMLIARAGTRESARTQLASQLDMWQQNGFFEYMAPERVAAYQLLAGKVLETQRLMHLDWRRLLGLYLWYGTPNTTSAIAAVMSYLIERTAAPETVPYPVPYFMEGLQPSATGATKSGGRAYWDATDVQWELLRLWGTTPAAATADLLAIGQEASAKAVADSAAKATVEWMRGGGFRKLLRSAGYSPNPLDYSLAWFLMTALQSLKVLPMAGDLRTSEAATSDGTPITSYDNPMLAVTLEFVSQLHLTGGLCEWAVFVALTIPDFPECGPAIREEVVRELLALTVPEWADDSTRRAFLEEQLGVPGSLLAEARATWAKYTRDDYVRCMALLDAGLVDDAHAVFVASVGPALFLSGSWHQLDEVLAKLSANSADTLPAWESGGMVYAWYMHLFSKQSRSAAAAAVEPMQQEMTTVEQLQHVASIIMQAKHDLDNLIEQPASARVDVEEMAEHTRLRRRLVLSQISARVHSALMAEGALSSGSGPAAAAGGYNSNSINRADLEKRFGALQSCLALQGCMAAEMQLGSVAVAVAGMGAGVAC